MDKNKAAHGDFVDNAKPVEAQKDAKKTKKKSGKPNFFKRIGAKIKDVFSELKKVTWPTFGKTVKKTCVVIVVVLAFLVVITAFDYGLMQLLTLVKPQ